MKNMNIENVPCYMPIFCNLEGRKVVVVGGGKVAFRKIQRLLSAGADIRVISPEVVTEIEEIDKKGKIILEKRKFQEGDLKDAWLVIAATDEPSVQRTVFQEAEAARCFCNVVDKPDVCSFIVPSEIRRGNLCIAISTSGQSPGLARHLRKELEREFGQEWAVFVNLLGQLRRIIIEKFSGEQRRKRLDALLNLQCLEWIRQGCIDEIEQWAMKLCDERVKGLRELLQ